MSLRRGATGDRAFDMLCATLEIEHRPSLPKSPRSEPLSAVTSGTRTVAHRA